MTSTWRGFNAEPYIFPPTTQSALDLKANILRYAIAVIDSHIDPPINWTPQQWSDLVHQHLDYIDSSVLPLLPGKARLMICMLHPPGWFLPNGRAAMFSTKPWGRVLLIDLWKEIAERYKNNPTVFCYDVMNEPAGSALNVNALNLDLVNAIRAIDPNKRITVSSPFGEPTRFNEVALINSKNIWYQTHFYYPWKFTNGEIPLYPTATWNREFLKEKLERVRTFQKTNHARMFVGEFGAFNTIPDSIRAEWFRDCIRLFEKYDWAWTFQAWTTVNPWTLTNSPLTLNTISSKWALNRRT